MEENFEDQNKSEDKEEEKDVEMFEFSLDEEEIDELIVKLVELKHMKQSFNFEVDDENELQISFEESDTIEGTSEEENEEESERSEY
jgi:hypothetical protein